MLEPLISVVIPVFNGERYLAEAVSSVLGQSPARRLEVLVVDDGSTDGSAAVARSFPSPVRLIEAEHGGLGATRNRGVAAAQGAFLAFLDADDVWMPEKLALQIEHLEAHPLVDMVFALQQNFHSPELTAEERQLSFCPPEPQVAKFAGTLLIRREAFDRVGPFATCWNVGEFLDWYCRAQEHGIGEAVLPQVLLRRRLHCTNLGIQHRGAQDFVNILRASLKRRARGKAPEAIPITEEKH